MPPFVLGPLTFPTKGAAKAEYRRILNGTPLDVPLQGRDAELVAALIAYSKHENLRGKIGPGITSVVVRKSKFGTRAFWLWRTDGTCVDFSFHTALDGPPSASATLRAALRQEVDDQIHQFREQQLATARLSCGICGRMLGYPSETHVDHIDPTFAEMANKFVVLVESSGYSLAVKCGKGFERLLVDRELAQVWWLYHEHSARLRLTHAACNLGRKRGEA